MLDEWVQAYSAVRRGMMQGKSVIEVQFGEQRVKYTDPSGTLKLMREEIMTLHRACPSDASAAILGLGGGNAGPIGTNYGQRNCGFGPL